MDGLRVQSGLCTTSRPLKCDGRADDADASVRGLAVASRSRGRLDLDSSHLRRRRLVEVQDDQHGRDGDDHDKYVVGEGPNAILVRTGKARVSTCM